MMLSLTLSLPLCTMKTSWPLMEVFRLTHVSPLLNFLSSQVDGFVVSLSQIASTSSGWDDPEKIFT